MGYQGLFVGLFLNLSCKKYSKQLDWIRTRRLKWSSSSIPLHYSSGNMRECLGSHTLLSLYSKPCLGGTNSTSLAVNLSYARLKTADLRNQQIYITVLQIQVRESGFQCYLRIVLHKPPSLDRALFPLGSPDSHGKYPTDSELPNE